jgi:UDP-N-acetylmuramate--L-alanine ligase
VRGYPHATISGMKGHLYFVGIVGHAMRGLALAARDLGYTVTGFDPGAEDGPGTKWLADHKLHWTKTFAPKALDGVTTVIVTGAHVSDDAPVIVEARARHIAIKSYAQLFGELTKGKHVIDVAGTHGKTTTSSLITWLLESAGRKPDFLIGIRPFNFDTSVRITGSDIVVAEGDEYRASPLETKSKIQYHHPDVLVLTSAEHDHPDFFPDEASVIKRFREIVDLLPADGRLIACLDGANVGAIASAAACPLTTYGLGTSADYTARDIAYQPTGIEFDLVTNDRVLGRVAVQLFGKHNVLNSVAASVAALGEGITIDQILEGAATFKGSYRRFNVITEPGAKVTVIDDYAHHPTEVATNIEAARLHYPGRRVVVVFRPHTYSRTKALLPDYQTVLNAADLVYVTDIEGAREQGQTTTLSGNDIVQALTAPALYVADRSELVKRVAADSQAGDVVLCFTVSGYDDVAHELAKTLGATSATAT